MRRLNRPVPFAGTREERDKNRRSHHWQTTFDEEVVCFDCDAKPWHIAADYPCGVRPPREEVTFEANGMTSR